MQSKTSFFNQSVFWKSVSRFWPVWGAYLAIWIILLPIVILANRYSYVNCPYDARSYVLGVSLYGGIAMTAIFGVFSAMAVWGYQFSARSAHGMACLPVRREGLFVSSALAGLLPMLAANIVVFALGYLAMAGVGCADFGAIAQGFMTVSLLLVFFFGFASFCAQLTGNILVLPLVYAVLNFVFVAAELMVHAILDVFVFGMDYDGAFALKLLSPVVGISEVCKILNEGSADCTIDYAWLIAVYAAVGVLFLAAALLLYRRRRTETAGDVVAINLLKPVFRWCMAIGCALCLACLINLIFDLDGGFTGSGQMTELLCLIGLMLLGALIGWFAAEMMIRKSFRVFRKTWLGLGVCWILIAAVMFACEFDLFGYERFVPDPAKVQNVTMYCEGERILLTEPENIAALCGVHRSITENKAVNERDAWENYGEHGRETYARFFYQMANGRTVRRSYYLPYDRSDPATWDDVLALEGILNCPEAIRERKELSLPVTPETIEYAGVDWTMSAAEWADALGYETPEEFVLCGVYGFTPGEVSAMDDDERSRVLCDAINYNAVFPEHDDLYYYTYDVPTSFPGSYSRYPGYSTVVREMEGVTPAELADIDWRSIKFNYEKKDFTDAEICELYQECILPDLADGTLGRVWIITGDDYRESVYDANITISLSSGIEFTDGRPWASGYFYTVPTVDSVRTNAWLTDHGVTLYTIAER